MSSWAGIALALRHPDEDAMKSRVPTYIHPLAGRALAWHGLRTLASLDPPPANLFLLTAVPLDESVIRDLPVRIVRVAPDEWWAAALDALDESVERVLLVDAAAPTLGPSLQSLVGSPRDGAIVGAAARLAADGVDDQEVLDAVAYHTIGHPSLGRLGRAVYLADFLEPGRTFEPEWRASLRARMPDAFDDVLREVVAARIAHLLQTGRRVRPETVAFWNAIAGGE